MFIINVQCEFQGNCHIVYSNFSEHVHIQNTSLIQDKELNIFM